jgi:mannose-6-phosphate isomerase-like protein (cupin superfamily)
MTALVPNRYATPVDKSRVEAEWNERGFSCDWMMDSTRREWRDCIHGADALLVVVDGELEVVVNGQKWVVHPGDEMLVPRGAVHHLKNLSPVTSRWLYGFGPGEVSAESEAEHRHH